MICKECSAIVGELSNEHLLACCGLTLQEYALRHALPLDLLLTPDRLTPVSSETDLPLKSATVPDETARAVFAGLKLSGKVQNLGCICQITGEIAWLDLLLWDMAHMESYGFQFRQEYRYSSDTNRVVALNTLVTLQRNLIETSIAAATIPPPERKLKYAVYLAHAVEQHSGFLFLPFSKKDDMVDTAEFFLREFGRKPAKNLVPC